MTSPVLLILGSLTEFTALVRLANEKGIRTVVADGNAGTEAKRLAALSFDVDVRDTEAIADICRKEGVTAITTGFSDLLFECAVRIAERAGLPYHIRENTLPFYRDKHLMKAILDELGIQNAKSAVIHPSFRDEELTGLTWPLIVKPLDLYGSRGLRIVETPAEIREHFEKMRLTDPGMETLLVEEYNSDPEFNIQAFMKEGQVHVLGICDREKTPSEPGCIPLSTRNVYPAASAGLVIDAARDVLSAFAARTGQTDGPISMQFFYSPERGLSVGEIAGRFLGYEHELIEYACGLSIEELLIAEALGDDREVSRLLETCRPLGKRSAAVLYFHARDGILACQDVAEAIARREDVVLYELFYRPGDRIGDPQSMPYFARYNIVTDTREETDQKSRDIAARMSATDADGRELVRPVIIPYMIDKPANR